MVAEHENEEYHFDDEPVEYEYHADTGSAESPTSSSEEQGLVTKLRAKRKIIIIGVVMLVVVYFVFAGLQENSQQIQPLKQSSVVMPPAQLKKPVMQQPTLAAQKTPAEKDATPKPAVKQSQGIVAPDVPASLLQPSTGTTSTAPKQQAKSLSVAMPNVDTSALDKDVATPLTSIGDEFKKKTNKVSAKSSGTEEKLLAKIAQLEKQNQVIMQVLEKQASRTDHTQDNDRVTQKDLTQLSKKMTSIEKHLTALSQTVKRQQASSSRKTQQGLAMQQQAAPQPAEKPMQYAVQAIIPGRAWLQAANGETVTISVGSIVKGVGRVIQIDPYAGTVILLGRNGKNITLSYDMDSN